VIVDKVIIRSFHKLCDVGTTSPNISVGGRRDGWKGSAEEGPKPKIQEQCPMVGVVAVVEEIDPTGGKVGVEGRLHQTIVEPFLAPDVGGDISRVSVTGGVCIKKTELVELAAKGSDEFGVVTEALVEVASEQNAFAIVVLSVNVSSEISDKLSAGIRQKNPGEAEKAPLFCKNGSRSSCLHGGFDAVVGIYNCEGGLIGTIEGSSTPSAKIVGLGTDDGIGPGA
jgi:hypothetical protein